MKIRRQRKAQERLDTRQRAFDRLSAKEKQGQKRPGSLNPKRGSASPSMHQ